VRGSKRGHMSDLTDPTMTISRMLINRLTNSIALRVIVIIFRFLLKFSFDFFLIDDIFVSLRSSHVDFAEKVLYGLS
jgi:hypothetical protein